MMSAETLTVVIMGERANYLGRYCVATAYGRRAAQLHQPDDGVAEGCNYAAEAVNNVEAVSRNTLGKLGSTCFCVLGPCMAFLGICISCLGMVFCL